MTLPNFSSFFKYLSVFQPYELVYRLLNFLQSLVKWQSNISLNHLILERVGLTYLIIICLSVFQPFKQCLVSDRVAIYIYVTQWDIERVGLTYLTYIFSLNFINELNLILFYFDTTKIILYFDTTKSFFVFFKCREQFVFTAFELASLLSYLT